jgi:hypothetical protein
MGPESLATEYEDNGWRMPERVLGDPVGPSFRVFRVFRGCLLLRAHAETREFSTPPGGAKSIPGRRVLPDACGIRQAGFYWSHGQRFGYDCSTCPVAGR